MMVRVVLPSLTQRTPAVKWVDKRCVAAVAVAGSRLGMSINLWSVLKSVIATTTSISAGVGEVSRCQQRCATQRIMKIIASPEFAAVHQAKLEGGQEVIVVTVLDGRGAGSVSSSLRSCGACCCIRWNLGNTDHHRTIKFGQTRVKVMV